MVAHGYKQPQRGDPSGARSLLATLVAIIGLCLLVFLVSGLVNLQRPGSKAASSQPTPSPSEHGVRLREQQDNRVAAPPEPPRPFNRCAEPIAWHIAFVDERFNVAEHDVHAAVERAAHVWQTAWPHQRLFVHDPDGPLPIHLAFDHNLHEMFRQREEYERLLNAFNEAVDAYNERVARHGRNVEEWNERGGRGTREEHQALERELENLYRERVRLRQHEFVLEQARPRGMHGSVRLAEYAEQFTYDAEPGIVTGILNRSITVHYFRDLDHLAFIIAHELGHALLGQYEHVDDPAALMHATPQRPSDGRLRLTEADREALRKACEPSRPRD